MVVLSFFFVLRSCDMECVQAWARDNPWPYDGAGQPLAESAVGLRSMATGNNIMCTDRWEWWLGTVASKWLRTTRRHLGLVGWLAGRVASVGWLAGWSVGWRAAVAEAGAQIGEEGRRISCACAP